MAETTRRAPNPSTKNDAEALRWLYQQHDAPCGEATCDSVYCYIAKRLATLATADTENVVFVPVTRELIPHMREWSEPVRVKLDEHGDGTYTLLVERADSALSVRRDTEDQKA